MSRPTQRILFALVVVVAAANALGCAGDGNSKSNGSAKTAAMKVTPEARAADPVYAYVDQVRGELTDGKTKLINDVMRMSPDESAKFWPIFRDYEEELFTLGDQRVEMTRAFVGAQNARTLDDATAARLTDQWFDFETKRLELLRRYQKQISSELSPLRAAQFTQIENRVGMVIDVVIASELPFVQVAAKP
jgi:hypothetical protein